MLVDTSLDTTVPVGAGDSELTTGYRGQGGGGEPVDTTPTPSLPFGVSLYTYWYPYPYVPPVPAGPGLLRGPCPYRSRVCILRGEYPGADPSDRKGMRGGVGGGYGFRGHVPTPLGVQCLILQPPYPPYYRTLLSPLVS